MNKINNFFEKIYSELALLTILLFFSFQVLNSFIINVFAINFSGFGISMYDLLILFLLSPLLLLIFKKKLPTVGLYIAAGIVVIARILMIFIHDIYFLAFITGAGASAFFVFLPAYLVRKTRDEKRSLGMVITQALGLAIGLTIALQVIGQSYDISTHGYGQIIISVLTIILVLMFPGIQLTKKTNEQMENEEVEPAKFGKTFLLALGIYGIIAIEWFVLAYPTAFSRWSNSSYVVVTILTLVMSILFVLLVTFIPKIVENIRIWMIVILNVLLLGSIVIVSALPQPEYTTVQIVFTYITAILSPIALLDFMLVSRELNKSQSTARQLGGTFGIASFIFMIVSFVMISSFNYEWVPFAGFLKSRFYIVMLLTVALVFIPIVFIKRFKNYGQRSFSELQGKLPKKNQIIAVGVIVLFAALTGIGLGINRIHPEIPTTPTTLSIMTYNVHQGEDKLGQPNLVRLLNSIRKADPDVLALQESETARVCFGSIDLVRYLAENLNMYYYYGPKTVTGTYGVATLSKYPIEFSETHFMPSGTHSHRVIIRTDLRVGSELIPFFNTHFGLEHEERTPQAAFVYELTSGFSRTFAVGDFNTKDTEFEYPILRLNFEDSWLTVNPTGLNFTGFNGDTNRFPRRRIDFILYTSDFTINDVSVLTWADESDHWPVFGTFSL